MSRNWFSMSTRRVRRMNPRQRKKHHAGEWRELGFQVKVRLNERTDESAFDALIDDLVLFIEARGLLMGGFGNPSELWHESFVCAAGRGSASDEDTDSQCVTGLQNTQQLQRWRQRNWLMPGMAGRQSVEMQAAQRAVQGAGRDGGDERGGLDRAVILPPRQGTLSGRSW